MIDLVFLTFVDLFVSIFNVLLMIRVISSYFVAQDNRFYGGLVTLTEPLLAPVRRVLPNMAGIDLAPIATFFLLQGLRVLAHSLF